jgi:protein N-terminal amidase
MAWLTRKDARAYSRKSKEPDMETLSYWLARLEPVIRVEDEGEIIVVLANRCGTEDDAVYAGTSCVLGIESGEVKVYGILGRGEKDLLVVDTTNPPKAKLIAEPHTNITENLAQTREASNLDGDDSDRNSLLASIDAVLSATAPVSPVEPRFPHAYFASQAPRSDEKLSKLKSSTAPTSEEDSSPSSDQSITSSIHLISQSSIDPLLRNHVIVVGPDTTNRRS